MLSLLWIIAFVLLGAAIGWWLMNHDLHPHRRRRKHRRQPVRRPPPTCKHGSSSSSSGSSGLPSSNPPLQAGLPKSHKTGPITPFYLTTVEQYSRTTPRFLARRADGSPAFLEWNPAQVESFFWLFVDNLGQQNVPSNPVLKQRIVSYPTVRVIPGPYGVQTAYDYSQSRVLGYNYRPGHPDEITLQPVNDNDDQVADPEIGFNSVTGEFAMRIRLSRDSRGDYMTSIGDLVEDHDGVGDLSRGTVPSNQRWGYLEAPI